MGMFDSFKSFFKKDNAIFPVEDVPLESYNGPPPIFLSAMPTRMRNWYIRN